MNPILKHNTCQAPSTPFYALWCRIYRPYRPGHLLDYNNAFEEHGPHTLTGMFTSPLHHLASDVLISLTTSQSLQERGPWSLLPGSWYRARSHHKLLRRTNIHWPVQIGKQLGGRVAQCRSWKSSVLQEQATQPFLHTSSVLWIFQWYIIKQEWQVEAVSLALVVLSHPKPTMGWAWHMFLWFTWGRECSADCVGGRGGAPLSWAGVISGTNRPGTAPAPNEKNATYATVPKRARLPL